MTPLQIKLEATLTENNVNTKLSTPGVLSGKSLLYVACLLDNEDAVTILLRKGAQVTLGMKKPYILQMLGTPCNIFSALGFSSDFDRGL